MPVHGCMICSNCKRPCPLCGTCGCDWLKKNEPIGVWTKVNSDKRISRVCHAFHMFGDMCAAHPPKPVDDNALDRAKGVIFEANMMAIPGDTCKYIAVHIEQQDEQLAKLRERIAELERA